MLCFVQWVGAEEEGGGGGGGGGVAARDLKELLLQYPHLLALRKRITERYFTAYIPQAGELPPLPEPDADGRKARQEDDDEEAAAAVRCSLTLTLTLLTLLTLTLTLLTLLRLLTRQEESPCTAAACCCCTLHPAHCSLPFLPALRNTCRRFDRMCVCVFRTPFL